MTYKQRMIEYGQRLSNPRVASSTLAGPTSLTRPSLPVANHNFPTLQVRVLPGPPSLTLPSLPVANHNFPTLKALSSPPSPEEVGFRRRRAEVRRRQSLAREAAARPSFSPAEKCEGMTLATLFAGFVLLKSLLIVCICLAGVGYVLVEGAISLGKGYHHL